MTIHTDIINRWSPVAFSDQPVEWEKLEALFEAAKWAPSSYNAQPWRFFYGQKGDELYATLFSLLSPFNQQWAKTAPLLVIGVAETQSPGGRGENRFAGYDTGTAVGNMMVQATSQGLFMHQMGGYDANGARAALNLPDSLEPMAMLAIGYKGDPSILDPEVAAREKRKRERKPFKEFVFNRPL